MTAITSRDAYRLLAAELAGYQQLGHSELAALAGQSFAYRQKSESAVEYDVTIQVRWLDLAGGSIVIDGTLGVADWGGPLARLDDRCVVPAPRTNP